MLGDHCELSQPWPPYFTYRYTVFKNHDVSTNLLSDFDLKNFELKDNLQKYIHIHSLFLKLYCICYYLLSSKYVFTFPLIHKTFRYE